MMDRVIAVFLTVGILALSGCNTMEGFGKDVKKVGSSIEKAAEKK